MPKSEPLITDEQSLVGATSQYGRDIPIYDDGYGLLFIHRDSMGISGIVRARTWEDAYSICEDEFFPEANETIEEIRKEYNFKREHIKIIKPKDGGPERPDTREDYEPTGKLEDWQFVRWETKETPCEGENGWAENDLFQEAFGFRPSGPNAKDVLKHGIYSKDLNGDSLDELTPALLEHLGVTLKIENNE